MILIERMLSICRPGLHAGLEERVHGHDNRPTSNFHRWVFSGLKQCSPTHWADDKRSATITLDALKRLKDTVRPGWCGPLLDPHAGRAGHFCPALWTKGNSPT